MRFSNFSFAFTVIKAQCPDQRLNAQCESVCIENFSICMETCEDSRLALISLNDKEPKFIFEVVSHNAIENMSIVLNIVLAMNSAQLVALTAKIQFVKVFSY